MSQELFPEVEQDPRGRFSQQFRRKLQSWLKVIGRHKYTTFEEDLSFLRWAFRQSRYELHQLDYDYFDRVLGKQFGKIFRKELKRVKASKQPIS